MQIGDLANVLTKVKRQSDGSFLALCPSHDDAKQSLHITQQDGKLLLKCFAGCTAESICQSLKIELSDLFTEEKPQHEQKKIVATYTYQDEQGKELYQVVRFDPKGFSQRHKNGGGEYVWKMDGVKRVLYHLPEVLKADKVYLVEGEKDADNLIAAGYTATTSPGGAGAWKAEYAQYLKGKQVVIIPDNDDAGFGYAKAISNSLSDNKKCILLPDTFKDISDWLKTGRTVNELGEQDVKALETTYTFENKSSRYIFKWGVIQCEVSRIKNTRDTTYCQLVFLNNGQHLLRTKFNLESSKIRTELAKDLSLRCKDTDWKKLLEDMSDRTLEEFEKGEPVTNVTSIDEVEELQYLIKPIAPLGKPTVLFGDPGSGKSQLSVIITMITSLPWHDNPLRLTAPHKPCKGLLLDWEADADDSRRQLKSLTEGMKLGYMELKYRRCSLPLASDIEAIRTHIEEVGADYLIIDSVSLAAGGDLNHMDVATNYFRALRQLNLTSISLAHTSKDRENKSKTILGSVLFEAGARSVWEVRGQEDEDCLDILLLHRKANLSKKSAPLGYRINYKNELPYTVEWHDPRNVVEFVERMGTNTRVIEYLKGRYGGATEDEIVKDLGITLNNCRVALHRLQSKTVIEKSGEKWKKV